MIGLLFVLESVSVAVDNDFTEHLVNDRVATLVSLDVPWEAGDTVDAIAFPPPEPEPEPEFIDYSVSDNSEGFSQGSVSSGVGTQSVGSSTGGSVAPVVKADFYPSVELFKDSEFGGSWIERYAEVIYRYDSVYDNHGPLLLGHNYNGMGGKVLGLRNGDIVQVHGTSLAGKYRVMNSYDLWWTPSLRSTDLLFSYDLTLQTCHWGDDNEWIRFVEVKKI